MARQVKQPLSKESLDHVFAKYRLAERLKKDWLRVDVEKAISQEGFVWLIPDVAVYDEDGIAGIYEVVVTSDLTLQKMNKIWQFSQDIMRPIFVRTITAQNAIEGKDEYLMNVII